MSREALVSVALLVNGLWSIWNLYRSASLELERDARRTRLRFTPYRGPMP